MPLLDEKPREADSQDGRVHVPKGFRKYGKLVARAAEECGVGFDTSSAEGARPAMREVIFLDTEDFRLYNNAFILRRRILYEDGFPVGDPEIVFKFRHPDLRRRPRWTCARNRRRLPDQVQGRGPAAEGQAGRLSACSTPTTSQFPLSHDARRRIAPRMETLVAIFPALQSLKKTTERERGTGQPDRWSRKCCWTSARSTSARGWRPTANVAVWRTRGEQQQLVGEFASRSKFKTRDGRARQATRALRANSSCACSSGGRTGCRWGRPRRAASTG